jgi:MFS family permease
VIFALANSVWMLLLARIIQGAGGGTTGVTQALRRRHGAPEDRARALGWLSAGTNVGTMVGPAVGSFLAYKGQAAPAITAAILCVINLAFAWRWLPESRKAEQHLGCPKACLAQRLACAVPSVAPVFAVDADLCPGNVWPVGAHGSPCAVLNSTFGVTEYTIGYFFVYVGIFSVFYVRLSWDPWWIDWENLSRFGWVPQRSFSDSLDIRWRRALWTLAVVIPLVPIGTALLFPATTALLSRSTTKPTMGSLWAPRRLSPGSPALSRRSVRRDVRARRSVVTVLLRRGDALRRQSDGGRLPAAKPVAQGEEGAVLN